MAHDASPWKSSLRIGLRYSGLFLLGAILFSFVYNIVVGFLASVQLVASGRIGLEELPVVYWEQWLKMFVAGDEYQTAWAYIIWSTQFFFIFASPVTIFSVVSFPVIFFSKRPKRRARILTIIYFLLYSANLWVVAMGIASI